MTGVVYINGVNAQAAYGICLRDNAYGEFLKKPKRKYQYINNWVDQNGTQRYPVDTPTFETRTLAIPVQMKGDNDEDFFQKDAAFLELIEQGGYWQVDVVDLGKRYYLLYDDVSNVQQIQDPSTGKTVISNFNLVLLDDYPTDTGDVIPGITDENGNYILDNNNLIIEDAAD